MCMFPFKGRTSWSRWGGGGGVEEFVKKKFADPQKGIKKFLHTQHCEKTTAKQNIKVLVLYMFIRLKLLLWYNTYKPNFNPSPIPKKKLL